MTPRRRAGRRSVVAVVLSWVAMSVAAPSTVDAAGAMYWTDADHAGRAVARVLRADLDGTLVERLVIPPSLNPRFIALDEAAREMYWTDIGRIDRAKLDGSGLVTVVPNGGLCPMGIALDVAAGKMYWTDCSEGTIRRAGLNGAGVEILVTGLGDVRGLALDLLGGKMYWTETAGRVARANLDGTATETLTEHGSFSHGIALDVAGGKLYWTESGRIRRADLDGAGAESLVEMSPFNPLGIALDVAGGKLYWTEAAGHRIRRANLDGSDIEDIVSTGLDTPWGIALALAPPPPPPAVVQFSAPAYTVRTDTASALISVVRTDTLSEPFTVAYRANGLTAVEGRDFTPVSGTLTFTAGATTRTFVVPIRAGTVVEDNLTVLLTLSPPHGNAVLGARSTATLTIHDGGTAGTFHLGAAAYTVAEGAGSVQVTILRTGTRLAGDVSVDFTTANGSGAHGAVAGRNYAAVAGAVTFGAGETVKAVTIPILPDGLVTGRLTFTGALRDPSGGGTLGVPHVATIAIEDRDRGGVVQFSASTTRVNQTTGQVAIALDRRNGIAGGVLVNFETRDGNARAGRDYARTTGTLTFGANQSTALIALSVIDQHRVTGDRSFAVVLTGVRGGATLGSRTRTTVTIVDDHFAIELTGRARGNDLEVVRTGSLTMHGTVRYQAVDGTAVRGVDYDIPEVGILELPPGVARAFIPVTVLDDIIAEGRETFTIVLSDPSPPGVLGRGSSRTFGIGDNDFGGVVSFSQSRATVAPGSTPSITITRRGGLGTILTVNWAAIGGSAMAGRDFSPSSGAVTFGPNDSSRNFTVGVADQAAGEIPERTIILGMQFPPGAAARGAVPTLTLKIPGRRAGITHDFSTHTTR